MPRKLSIFKSPYALTILTLLFSFSVNAQQANSSAEESSNTSSSLEKRYRVEVIVFNYNGPISANGEIWHRVSPIEFSAESYASEIPETNEIMPTPTSEVQDPIEFTELKALSPYLSKLLADSRYEIIAFVAWTQPLYDKKSSIAVDLNPPLDSSLTGEIRPFTRSPITGSIQLFETRLLFVDLDLRNELNMDYINQSGITPTDTNQPTGTFRIREKRRVKLNEIHYFDHPFFGALVRVSRV